MRLATLSSLASCFTILFVAAVACNESGDSYHGGHGNFKRHKKVMGYWPVYNAKIQYPQQLNWDLYTDVTFFVAVPELDYTFTYPRTTVEVAERLAMEFVQEARKHNVNTLLSVGGWTGSLHISNLTATAESRSRFANAIVNHCKKFGFGGVDIDWEFPNSLAIGCNSHRPRDVVNFGLLVKEIRELWDEAQITAAISVTGLIGADGKAATTRETALLVEYLNFVNLMAYDMFGAWSLTTGPIAPISGKCDPSGAGISVETGIAAMLKQGFPADHILLGIPAYAKRLQLVSSELKATHVGGMTSFYYQNHTKVTPRGGRTDDPPGPDVCGVYTPWGGSWLVNDIIAEGWLSKDQRTGGNGYVRHYDPCSGLPFLTDGKYFISYDDQFSTVAKADIAKERGLAGIFFFDTEGAPDTTIIEARKEL